MPHLPSFEVTVSRLLNEFRLLAGKQVYYFFGSGQAGAVRESENRQIGLQGCMTVDHLLKFEGEMDPVSKVQFYMYAWKFNVGIHVVPVKLQYYYN